MRGTLHLVAAEDVGWLLAYLGPVFIRTGRRRRAELGLDDKTAARALRDVLADSGPLTREEVAEQLAARGIRLAGQARPHLLGLAALDVLVEPFEELAAEVLKGLEAEVRALAHFPSTAATLQVMAPV